MPKVESADWRYVLRSAREPVMSNGDLKTHLRLAPFLSLDALLCAGCADGFFEHGTVRMPFRRIFPAGMLCGGYLHSEIFTLATGETQWSGLDDALADSGVAWLLAEAPQEDSALHGLCATLRKAGWRVYYMPGRASPYIDFTWKEGDFYAALRRANAKEHRNLRTSWRKLKQAGKVEIRFSETEISPELAALLGEVEKKSTKKGTGIFSPQRLRTTLALLDRESVHLALLYLDGTLAAWDLDFFRGGVVYSYNRSYDRSFSAFGPGKILHYANLAHAYARGARKAELLGDADALKMRMATGTRQRCRIAAFSAGFMGSIAHRLFSLRQARKQRGQKWTGKNDISLG